MSTLASGASITLTLQPGQTVNFEAVGSGSVVIGPGGQAGQSFALGSQFRTVGPFEADQVLYVTATTGDIVYSIAGLTSAIDVATNVTLSPATASAYEVNLLLKQISQAGGGSILFPASSTAYVFDDEILAQNNTAILFSPGVVLTRPDPFTLICATQNGSRTVQVVSGDTSRIKTGLYSAQYVVGTGIPINTRVSSIESRTTFSLDAEATANDTVTLTFHYSHNIIRRQNVINTRILAPWGRAILDANGLNGPITGSQEDYIRNCIRTAYCTDAETSGVLLTKAFFHGEIGVNNCGKINLENIQTYQNGYRGVHYHGDSPDFVIEDLTADKIESLEDGQIAFQVSGNDWNTGIFIVYDGCRRYQVGRLRVRRQPGLGVHLNGNVASGNRSTQINYGSIIAEDCYFGVGLFNGLRHLSIASIQAKGTITQIAGVTLGNATSQLPRYNSSGVYIPGAVMMPMVLPGGTDMTQFYRGMVVLLQDVAAVRNVARRIWSVDTVNRTITVFADDNGATRPWDVSLDSTTTTVTFGTMRNALLLSTSSDSTQQMQGVSIGTLQAEGVAGRPIACNAFGAGVYAADSLAFGVVHLQDCIDGGVFANVRNPYIGTFTSRNIADRRTGNDTSSIDLSFNRCDSVHVGKFDARSTGTGSTTRSNATLLQFPNGSSNVKVFNVIAQNGNGTNFAVDWSSCTNIVIGDFRNAAGTSLTPVASPAPTNGSLFRYGLT